MHQLLLCGRIALYNVLGFSSGKISQKVPNYINILLDSIGVLGFTYCTQLYIDASKNEKQVIIKYCLAVLTAETYIILISI